MGRCTHLDRQSGVSVMTLETTSIFYYLNVYYQSDKVIIFIPNNNYLQSNYFTVYFHVLKLIAFEENNWIKKKSNSFTNLINLAHNHNNPRDRCLLTDNTNK